MNPMCRARQSASSRSGSPEMSVPATRTLPAVGWSMPATRFSSVDFPDPDGPISPRNSASATSSETSSSTGTLSESRR